MNRTATSGWIVSFFLIMLAGLLTLWLYFLIAQLDRTPHAINHAAIKEQTPHSIYPDTITLLPMSNVQLQVTNFRAQLVMFFLVVALQFLILGCVIYGLARRQAFRKISKRGSRQATSLFNSAQPIVEPTTNRWLLLSIFIFAALFRVVLLSQTPWLSDDIYRYLWDGRVLANGINPFHYPPSASELAPLRDDKVFVHINHKEVITVYPPLLQAIFWLAHQLGGTVGILKGVFISIDLFLILLLFWSLPKLKTPSWWAILYAWHPLAVIEIAGSGHGDAVGALFLFAAVLWLALGRQPAVAIVFLALSFLTKFLPLLLLPFLFLYAHHRSRNSSRRAILEALSWLVFFSIIVVVAYLPFIESGPKLIAGVLVYAAKWRFNDALFGLFYLPIHRWIPEAFVYQFMIPPEWEVNETILASRRIDLALFVTKILVAGIFMGFLTIQWQRFRGKLKPPDPTEPWENLQVTEKKLPTGGHLLLAWPTLALNVIGIFLLLSPTIQPWYLLWMLPFSCLVRQPSWLAWSGTIFLAYWVLEGYARTGLWQEVGWVKAVEYGVVLAVAIMTTAWKGICLR